jgi:hypothetical protein
MQMCEEIKDARKILSARSVSQLPANMELDDNWLQPNRPYDNDPE